MVQVWPSDDTFAYGSPVYGSGLIGYLGARPAVASWSRAALVRAYTTHASAALLGGSATVPSAWMRRQLFAEDVRVRLVARSHGVTGSPTTAHAGMFAVLARIQGGTLAGDGSAAVRYEGLDCYAFTAHNLTPTTVRYRLLRYNAGVETVLATVDGDGEDVGHFLQDARLVLVVETVGAEVHLTGGVANLGLGSQGLVVYQPGGSGERTLTGSAVPGGPAPAVGTILSPPSGAGAQVKSFTKALATVDVIAAVDASGDRITGTGRCGFGLPVDRDHGGGIRTVGLASVFEVEEGDDVAWRDEWQRAALSLCQAVTDAHGTPGRNLASDYATDQASVETAEPLQRSLSEEAIEAEGSLPTGEAVTFTGGLSQAVTLPEAHNSFPASAPAASVQFTLAHWVKIDTNRNGNQFYEAFNSSLNPMQGVKWGWRDAGSGNALIEVVLGGKATEQVFQGDPFPAAPYLGQAWCFVLTYKANAHTPTGTGRLRIYVGRLGTATLLDEITVPADTRPLWNNAQHQIGQRAGVGGPTTEALFDGLFDDTSIFFAELTAAQVDDVCNQFAPKENLIPYGLVHAVDWEVHEEPVSGQFRWRPWYPPGIDDGADWWQDTGVAGPATGIVPAAVAPKLAWHQRPASDPRTQSRSIAAVLAADFSSIGVVLRGTPGSTPGAYSGYLVTLSPGAPAAIDVYRVAAGVATKLGRQSPATGPVDVSTGAPITLEAGVSQASSGLSGPVLLKVVVSGQSVPMEVTAPDCSLDINGNLIDAGAARILSGPAEAFAYVVDTLPTLLDDWLQGQATPPAPDPSDFPNIAVPAEIEGAVGDLGDVLTPDWAIEPMHLAPKAVHAFDSGHRNRIALQTYERRRFALQKVLNASEYAALLQFWDDHGGAEIGFAWDPSPFFPFVQQAGVFHFLEEKLEVRRGPGAAAYTVRFTVEERRAAASS